MIGCLENHCQEKKVMAGKGRRMEGVGQKDGKKRKMDFPVKEYGGWCTGWMISFK